MVTKSDIFLWDLSIRNGFVKMRDFYRVRDADSFLFHENQSPVGKLFADPGGRLPGSAQKVGQKGDAKVHVDEDSVFCGDTKVPGQLPELGSQLAFQVDTANGIFQLVFQTPDLFLLIRKQRAGESEILFHQREQDVSGNHIEMAGFQRLAEDRTDVPGKAFVDHTVGSEDKENFPIAAAGQVVYGGFSAKKKKDLMIGLACPKAAGSFLTENGLA